MDDQIPVAALLPPRPDPRQVALGFALEIHRGDGRGYSGADDHEQIIATADHIHSWLDQPAAGRRESGAVPVTTELGYAPLWALHLQRMIQQVLNKLGVEMATLADIQNTVQELAATDGTIITALDDLKAKVDAGGTVTAADLDGVNDTIKAELTKLQEAVNRDDPAPAPAPAPVDPNPSPTGP